MTSKSSASSLLFQQCIIYRNSTLSTQKKKKFPTSNPNKEIFQMEDKGRGSFWVGNTLCLCRSSWVSSLKLGRLASLSSLVGINASLGSASFSEEEAAATTINGRWSLLLLLPLPSTSLPCSLRPLTKSNRENKKKEAVKKK